MSENYAHTIVGIVIGIIITICFYSPTISNLNNDIDSKNSQIEELQSEIEEQKNSLNNSEETEEELENKNELINILQKQLLSYGIEPDEL
jgi:Tfp pilus assembly protein PilO